MGKKKESKWMAIFVLFFFFALGYYLIRMPTQGDHETIIYDQEEGLDEKSLELLWTKKEKNAHYQYYALYPKQSRNKNVHVKRLYTFSDSISRTQDALVTQSLPDSVAILDSNVLNLEKSELIEPESLDTLGDDLLDSASVQSSDDAPINSESTVVPSDQYCIIVVGAFAKPINAEKAASTLNDLGFEVKREMKNQLTLVGALSSCEKKALQKNLNTLRAVFDQDAYVQ